MAGRFDQSQDDYDHMMEERHDLAKDEGELKNGRVIQQTGIRIIDFPTYQLLDFQDGGWGLKHKLCGKTVFVENKPRLFCPSCKEDLRDH